MISTTVYSRRGYGTRHRLRELFRLAATHWGATGVNIHAFSDVGRGERLSGGVDSIGSDPHKARMWHEGILRNVISARLIHTNLDIQVELGFAGSGQPGENPAGCAVRDRTNLQFCVSPDGSDALPVIACGLQMSRPDTSAYVFRGGELRPRQGPSELTLTQAETAGCPLPDRSGAICIYDRLT